jgi:hypothetical protein
MKENWNTRNEIFSICYKLYMTTKSIHKAGDSTKKDMQMRINVSGLNLPKKARESETR